MSLIKFDIRVCIWFYENRQFDVSSGFFTIGKSTESDKEAPKNR